MACAIWSMLDGLMVVSRAQRCPLQIETLALHALFTGHIVLTEHEAGRDVVHVDRRAVLGVLEEVGSGAPCSIRTIRHGDSIELEIATTLVSSIDAVSSLAALLRSLHLHGGTAMVALASWQVMLGRCGGSLSIDEEHIVVTLPLAT